MGSKGIFKVILGLLVMIAGAYGMVYWRGYVMDLLKGTLGPSILLMGLLILIIGMSDFKG